MSSELGSKGKPIPYRLTPDDDVELVMDSFRVLFGDEVEMIKTGEVHSGSTSALVYVPPKYINKRVTVIVWKNKERYFKGGKVVDGDGAEVAFTGGGK